MKPHTTVSSTGQPCPTSGLWQSMGHFKTTIPMKSGNEMPSYCGSPIEWILILPDRAIRSKKSIL
ncbi:hypothetical protein OF897_18460 [Chryseobacterium formosus]|uniref:Uncharacterized protein n=1 Tax=Chryseobacterium formosus TaxID=1537363 RepID=A0ABT3XW34_9FLAO|nr:hypothetical protein [Chryseobacterium formosus]MCX8525901.1 hypothetical protein [Chryseobacterium formosus]